MVTGLVAPDASIAAVEPEIVQQYVAMALFCLCFLLVRLRIVEIPARQVGGTGCRSRVRQGQPSGHQRDRRRRDAGYPPGGYDLHPPPPQRRLPPPSHTRRFRNAPRTWPDRITPAGATRVSAPPNIQQGPDRGDRPVRGPRLLGVHRDQRSAQAERDDRRRQPRHPVQDGRVDHVAVDRVAAAPCRAGVRRSASGSQRQKTSAAPANSRCARSRRAPRHQPSATAAGNAAASRNTTSAAASLYQDLLKRLKEGGMLENLRSSNITVVDPGRVPSKPKKPNVPLYLAIALVLGLFTRGGCVPADRFRR